MKVLLRILIATAFTYWLLFTLISCDEQRREIAISKNNKFCGYFIEYNEQKSSRSNTIYRYAKIKENNLRKLFLLTYRTTGLDNLVVNKEVCLTYYTTLFSESAAIHISSKEWT